MNEIKMAYKQKKQRNEILQSQLLKLKYKMNQPHYSK